MNKLLGELEIEIKDQKFVLRPTFEGLLMMEDLSGKTIAELVNSFLKAKPGMKDIVAVLYGGIYGGLDNKKPSVSFEELGSMVLLSGMANYYAPCATIVASAYTGKPCDTPLKSREEAKIGSEKPNDQEKKSSNSGELTNTFTWEWFYSTWVLGFNQRSSDFWLATPWEFWALFERRFASELKKKPLTKDRLEEMMEKYPDGNNS